MEDGGALFGSLDSAADRSPAVGVFRYHETLDARAGRTVYDNKHGFATERDAETEKRPVLLGQSTLLGASMQAMPR